MDLLPIQAVKPNTPSPVPVPTTDGAQGFSDLIDTLLAGLTSTGTGPAIGEEGGAGENEENPILSDEPDPLSVSADRAIVAPVVATVVLQTQTTPASDSTQISVPDLVSVEPQDTLPEQRVHRTPHDVEPVSVVNPASDAGEAGPEVELIPVATSPLARDDGEPASSTPLPPGAGDAHPVPGTVGPGADPTTESGPATRQRLVLESPGRQEPVETSPKVGGAERMEVPGPEPLAPPRPGGHDPTPVTNTASPQVARIADTSESGHIRAASAELIERLTEWAERVEMAQRSDSISLRLTEADGEMLVRLSLREGRLELHVSRPGGETLPWLADQIGDALAERGFDMAESGSRQGHDDEAGHNRRESHPGAKATPRQQDGILM